MRERLCNSCCYRFTVWKNIFQNHELINSLEFFFFILMNYIVKDYNAFCTAFISLKLLLSKILLFSHFVGEPNYWSVEFHPRNSNSRTFLNFSILLFSCYIYTWFWRIVYASVTASNQSPAIVWHNDTYCTTKNEFLPTVNP